MASVDGLITGLDTKTIIAQLMAIERLPKQQILDQQSTSQSMVSTLQALNSLVTNMMTAAKGFVPDSATKASAWTSTTATSSNNALATVLSGSGALPGSATFTVTSVAAANVLVSAGTVGSLTAPITANSFTVSQGATKLGLTSLDAGANLSAGAHKVEVTQSSAGATMTGTAVSSLAAMPPAVTIDSSNNAIKFYRDGSAVATTIALNPGTYSPVQLAAEIARASGGALKGSVDTSGRLQVTSVGGREGSAATLQLAEANSALGLTDITTVSHGVDGIIEVDGVATSVSAADAGHQQTLNGVAGTGDSVSVTLAGGLRKGVATTTVVAANASLANVVQALNGPGTGVSAAAVQVADGAYRLMLTSTTTGSASGIVMGGGAFSAGLSSLGDMQQLTAGTDTVLHIGTGAAAFDVTSSTTSVTGLLPGVTITALKQDPASPVTINVVRDTNGIADKMAAMVAQANSVLSYIDTKSAYDAVSKTGGVLLGDSMGRDLRARITDSVIGTSSITPALSGVSVARDGSITFDKAVFLAAYAKDPTAVTETMTSMSQQTTRITDEKDSAKGYTKQIAAFEEKMTLRQESLKRQYAALEVMLGKLKSQSEWLTGQLASLPTYSSNSK
jgi:flagellar hook-associated protein 2